MEFLRIWGVVARRRWLILGLFAAFFLAVVVGTKTLPPLYRARVKLLLDETTDTPQALLAGLGLSGLQRQSYAQSSSDSPYDTDIALTTLRPLLERVIATLHLKRRNGSPTQYDRLTEGFLRKLILPEPHLKVDQYQDATILRIDAFSTDPEEAAKMANTLAEYTVADRLARRRRDYEAARLFVEGRINGAREQYYAALDAVKDFKVSEGTLDLDRETENLLNKISTLNSTYEDNETMIVSYERRIEAAKAKLRDFPMYRKEAEEAGLNDQLNQLRTKMTSLLAGMAEKSADYTEEHPEYQKLAKQVEVIREQMRGQAELVQSGSRTGVDPAYDQFYKTAAVTIVDREAAVAKRNILRSIIDRYESDLLKIPTKVAGDAKLSLQLSTAKEVYSNLLKFMTQIGVAEAMTMSTALVVEPAAPPPKDRPYSPKKLFNYVLGLLLAGFWSLFIAFSVDYADQSVKAPEEVQRIRSVRLLGAVPWPPPWRGRPVILALKPTAPLVDAFRGVQLRLRRAAGAPLTTVLVASSVEREGTAFVAVNAAAAAVMDGARAIVVDLDLRAPQVHRFFGLRGDRGVAEVIAGTATLEDAIVATPHPGLDLLAGGAPPSDPLGAVRSPRVAGILAELASKYDLVVVAAAPLARVSDPLVLGALVGSLVLVARTGRSSAAMIEHAAEQAEQAGIRLLGVVVPGF